MGVWPGGREQQWTGRTFLRELFLGNLVLDAIHPFPVAKQERPEFRKFYDDLERFLREKVDPIAIDETGEYPEDVVNGLRKLGAFGIKIPKEYGGLGFTVSEYTTIMQMVGSLDGNIGALLSAHQSIGVPQPLKLFGTPDQKHKYLTRCAAGAISAADIRGRWGFLKARSCRIFDSLAGDTSSARPVEHPMQLWVL